MSSTSLQNDKRASSPELVTPENGDDIGEADVPCSSFSDLPNAFTDITESSETKSGKTKVRKYFNSDSIDFE